MRLKRTHFCKAASTVLVPNPMLSVRSPPPSPHMLPQNSHNPRKVYVNSGLKAEGNSTGFGVGGNDPPLQCLASPHWGFEVFPHCPAFRFLGWHVGLLSWPSLPSVMGMKAVIE